MKHTPLAYLIFIVLALAVLPACDFIIPSDTPESLGATALPEVPSSAAFIETPSATLEPDSVPTTPAATPIPPAATPTSTPIPAPTLMPAVAPAASFSIDVESGGAPVVVEFTNASEGPITSVEWDFGDGETSTDDSPIHRYTISGTYDVKLSVSGPGGDDTTVVADAITIEPGAAAMLEISPPTATLAVQEGTQFAAVARDEFGNVVPGTAGWSVIGDGGSITSGGIFTAGTVADVFEDIVKASFATEFGPVVANASVRVGPGPMTSIMAEPEEVTLNIGDTQQFTLRTFDRFQNQTTDIIAAWTIPPELGDIDANGMLTTSTLAGWFPSAVRLEVVEDTTRLSANIDLTISPDPLDSIDVQPDFAVVEREAKQQFEARGFDKFGNRIPGLDFLWEATGGDITPEGLFTAGEDSGSYEVNATGTFKERTLIGGATVPVPPVWILAGNMVSARSRLTATLLDDGTVLIVGGNENSDLAEIFDPVSRSFRYVGDSSCSHRAGAKATRLLDGLVLITGGSSDPRCAELYDPESGAFTRTSPMNEDRSFHTSTLLRDGRVLIAGGMRREDETDIAQDAAEIFDPLTGEFEATGRLMFARARHTATLLSYGDVLITGDEAVRVSELYTPSTGAFEIFAETKAGNAGAALLSDGNVLIATNQKKALLFVTNEGQFQDAGNMAVNRGFPTVTALPNGQALVTGGWRNDDGHPELMRHATAELFVSESGTFTYVGDLTHTRANHTATLLSNGWVLVVGGYEGIRGGNQVLVTRGELWIPSNEASN